jgi:uncharacterized protein YcbX
MTTLAPAIGFFIYPLKSAQGIACSSVNVASTGFEFDRQWMLVDTRGTFLSQRTHPLLARIEVELGPVGLRLSAPSVRALDVPYVACGPELPVRVHGDKCVGIDQGKDAGDWATEVIGQTARLVRVPLDSKRLANPTFAGVVRAPMGFADGFPLLVCNQASLDDLNTRLPKPIPMARFRPNIVLTGLDPWAEDRIDTVAVGNLILRLVKPCTRCVIPSVDQDTGLPSTDPLPALKSFRFNRALRGVTFGENAVIVSGVGTTVQPATCRINWELGH